MKDLTLAEFLRARITDDQAEAGSTLIYVPDHAWALRARAEAEAKRDVVDLHQPRSVGGRRVIEHECTVGDADAVIFDDQNPCLTLRLLALPYAHHPDYRDEWAPDGLG